MTAHSHLRSLTRTLVDRLLMRYVLGRGKLSPNSAPSGHQSCMVTLASPTLVQSASASLAKTRQSTEAVSTTQLHSMGAHPRCSQIFASPPYWRRRRCPVCFCQPQHRESLNQIADLLFSWCRHSEFDLCLEGFPTGGTFASRQPPG